MSQLFDSAELEALGRLVESDVATGGRPTFATFQDETVCKALIVKLVLDFELRREHCAWLQAQHPQLRSRDYPHRRILPLEIVEAIGVTGMDALTAEQLATLLLNPIALADLGEYIDEFLPKYWLPQLEAAGQKLIEKHGIKIPILPSPNV